MNTAILIPEIVKGKLVSQDFGRVERIFLDAPTGRGYYVL